MNVQSRSSNFDPKLLVRFGFVCFAMWSFAGNCQNVDFASLLATNLPPVSDAGADQSVTDSNCSGTAPVSLDGLDSFDPDGALVSFVWQEGVRELGRGIGATVELDVGVHAVTLVIADDLGVESVDQVIIEVAAGPGCPGFDGSGDTACNGADRDGDGVCDGADGCPDDGDKSSPGQCGCGIVDADMDSDGTADCVDGCVLDPLKTTPGLCGCGIPDTDTDADGVPDCVDDCPNSPDVPGQCGCGAPDDDSDGDGILDCDDRCPSDPNKVLPGFCGCGNPETDIDGDGTPDCDPSPDDLCPDDPNKTDPGRCGCGNPESFSAPVSWWPGDGDAADIQDENDGTLQGGAGFAPGKVGQGFSFDGVDDHVAIGNPANLSISGEITIDAWISTQDLSAGQFAAIVTKWGGAVSADAFGLWVIKDGDGMKLLGAIGDGSTQDSGFRGGVIAPNTFTHVAMTYNATTGENKLYVDGAEIASRVRPGGIQISGVSILIGREDSPNTRPFEGVIDEVEIVDQALSAAEIQAIVDVGAADRCVPS